MSKPLFGIDPEREFKPVSIAIMTVSDTRTADNDTSGDTLQKRAQGAGHTIKARSIVKDDKVDIAETVRDWSAREDIDIIISTGGTGITGRDVTVEALRPLFSKEIDGFSAVFHQISYGTVGTSTLQSRACAGIVNNTLVFCLPGSTGAVKDGWDGILQYQLDSRHQPCNFVEILPRLSER